MDFVEHLIIGGGISGCTMAHHLAKRKLNFKLIEAQTHLGGRIQSTDQGLDLGPTWYWPHQHGVKALLKELNISSFDQHTQGNYVYQADHNSPITQGKDQQAMLSHRINGGMGAMITALHNTLPNDAVLLNTSVRHLSKQGTHWTVEFTGGETLSCHQLWLAMPPRKIAPLLNARSFNKSVLSNALISHLQAQQTWMSAQAKFVAVYETAFWRDAGLSGQGFSRVGPMVEINDACGANIDHNPLNNSPAALFGFIGVPAVNRQSIDQQTIINACIAQLGTLFGEAALSPISTHYVDWARNEFVSTTEDTNEPSQHAHFDQAKFKDELNGLNLGLIGSEFSQTEPGYIAGAIEQVMKHIAGL